MKRTVFELFCTINLHIITHAGGRVFTFVCLSAFLHDISKTDAAMITNLDIEMFHDESWKPIFWGSKVKVTSHKNSASVGLCTLVSADF